MRKSPPRTSIGALAAERDCHRGGMPRSPSSPRAGAFRHPAHARRTTAIIMDLEVKKDSVGQIFSRHPLRSIPKKVNTQVLVDKRRTPSCFAGSLRADDAHDRWTRWRSLGDVRSWACSSAAPSSRTQDRAPHLRHAQDREGHAVGALNRERHEYQAFPVRRGFFCYPRAMAGRTSISWQ